MIKSRELLNTGNSSIALTKIKYFFFLLTIKLLNFFLKLFNLGGGTALPGLLAEKYLPNIFESYAKQLDQIIIITGTNGKTTTREFLSKILDQSGTKYISNTAGSNMKRGLLSAFIKNSSLFGKLKTNIVLFEIEEATLPKITGILKPDILIVTNLFRDQLDAYGEVNKTREYIFEAITKAKKTKDSFKVVLNFNDPLVYNLTKNLNIDTYYFSIPARYRNKFNFEGKAHRVKKLKDKLFEPTRIKTTKDLATEFTLNLINYKLNIPGVFHIYNALAAITTARLINISQQDIQKGFKKFKPAFGRGEDVKFEIRNSKFEKMPKHVIFKILLIKNPAGFTLTLSMLEKLKNIKIIIIINDKIADGRDVSWLWDSEVEKLFKTKPELIFISGTRAEDMALRLKYSQKLEKKSKKQKTMKEELHNISTSQLLVEPSIKKAIKLVSKKANDNETIYVLPTYTAMNEFRKLLGKRF